MPPWIYAWLAGLCLGLAPIDTPLGHAGWLVGVIALAQVPIGRPVRDTVQGGVAGLLWYGLSLRWVALQWVDLDGSLALPWVSWAGVAAVQASLPAITAGLAGAMLRRGWPRIVAIPVAWSATVLVAGWIQPLPGGLAVYGASLQPLLWPAAWMGLGGFMAVAGGVAVLVMKRPALGLPALGIWLGLGLLPPAGGGTELSVGLVQPNTGAFDGRRASTAEARQAKLVRLVHEAQNAGADWVVTPESAWPTPLDLSRPRAARALASAFGDVDWVVLGATLSDRDPPTNSLLLLHRGEVVARQDKVHLVPVSEKQLWGLGRDVFTPGARRTPWPSGAVGLICYEDLVHDGARQLAGASWVIAASNDAWLGAGPGARQHEGGARLAALRSGRWVVRPTANGRSAVFDPAGHRVWSTRWVDGDQNPSPGIAKVVRIRPTVPLWSGADVEPILGLLMALLTALGASLRGPFPMR